MLTGPLSGYLFTPTGATGPLSTLLLVGGYENTAEELFASVYPALERGYAFAAIDGPGQGAMLYDQRIPMRPDWENVVPGMVDTLLAHPEVDQRRLVLVGRSFGGLIAPRGASAEHRLAALVVDPGQYDMGAAVIARLGAPAQRLERPDRRPHLSGSPREPCHGNTPRPAHGDERDSDGPGYFKDMTRYHNRDTAPQISCPTYVTDNETDHVSTGQGQQLFDHLTCAKQFRQFTVAEGAAGHCEGMAPIVSGPPPSTGWTASCA